jgi:hypothetical protein
MKSQRFGLGWVAAAQTLSAQTKKGASPFANDQLEESGGYSGGRGGGGGRR